MVAGKMTSNRKTNINIELDTSFYPKKAIVEAQKAFSHLAQIKISKEKSAYLIEFLEVDQDLEDKLADEFANYALSIALTEN
jgi:hypothetical protein